MKKILLICLPLLARYDVFAQFTMIQVIGSNDNCGPSITLSVVGPQPGYTYNWFLGSYGCTTSGSPVPYGMPGNTLTAYATGEYFCYGLPPAGPPEISNPVIIRILPGSAGSLLMPAPAMGNPVTCVTSASLCVPFVYYQNWPGTLIKWYKDNVLIPGAVSSGYTATSTGYYKYSVTSGCMTAFSDSNFVTISPVAAFTANATGTICPGQLVTYSVTNPQPGTIYNWFVLQAGNYNFISAGTTFSYTAPIAGSLSVKLSAGSNGCSVLSSPHVLPTSPFTASISAGGPVTFCSGGQVLLSANPPSGSFTWLKNNNIISGASASTYIASAGGTYSCLVSNGSGCQDTSNTLVVTVNALPGASLTAQGPTSFCQGGSVLLQTAANPGNTYQWKKNGSPISGATSTIYSATTSGTYKVTVTKTTTGCSKTSSTGIVVTVYALPQASITPQGPTTFCSGDSVILSANSGSGFTYKWKKNGNYINGAIGQHYTVKTAGTYKVEVTKTNGCSKTSTGVVVSVPCRVDSPDPSQRHIISVFPNPSKDAFEISVNPPPADFSEIIIYDLHGKKRPFNCQWYNRGSGVLYGLEPGIYTAEFRFGYETYYRKLVRIR